MDQPEPTNIPEKKPVEIPSVVRVGDLADLLNQPVTEVIRALLTSGVLATINDNIDFDTAAIIADDMGFEPSELKRETDVAQADDLDAGAEMVERAPIVTVMGHVDHGKTSLLDYIRKAKVAEGESGGITQHISSYQIDYQGKPITFLDTPGHAAFSAIRAQGAKVTDVAVLVVAADDGVKPQTEEVINLAKAAKLPIIVAATKIDKPEADIEKVKQGLGAHNILTESWGGKVPLVGVSAKTGEGIDELLEMISLTSEVAELKARVDGPARGIIIESEKATKVGQTATVIIRAGTLRVGDSFAAGGAHGKVKAMSNYLGKNVKSAGPSEPVQVMGFAGEPQVGALLMVVGSEKEARALANSQGGGVSSRRVSAASATDLEALANQIQASKVQNLNVVVKADVQGSLQAIRDQLSAIRTDQGNTITVISDGLGSVSESDVLTAQGGGAFIVGFKVSVLPGATKSASREQIKILTYDIIYELTQDLSKLLVDSVGLRRVETVAAEGKVLKVFMSTQKNKIIGAKVKGGTVHKGYLMRVSRADQAIGEGIITTIKSSDAEVEAADAGEFGFMVEIGAKVKEGDTVEFIKVEQLKAKIV